MVCHSHLLLPQSSTTTSTMVCHSHLLLPQSSTSSSSIRPINLQPTANQASHLIYKPTIPTNRSLDLLPQATDLPQTTHIQPLQPGNGPPFAVGLIKPMNTDNPPYPQTHKHRTEVPIFFPRTEVELLPQTTHMQPLHLPWVSSSPWPINYVGRKYTQPSPKVYCSCLSLHSFPPFESGLKGFRLDVRQRTIPSFLQGSTLAVEYIAHVIGRCYC